MTLLVPLLCFGMFLALSSVAIFAPRPTPAGNADVRVPATEPRERTAIRSASRWPALVDPRAEGADAPLRLLLARELGTCGGAWAHRVVSAALGDEPDAGGGLALREALAAIESRAV